MPSPQRIPGYNFSQPTEADALGALQRVWDLDRGALIWSQACRAAGLVEGRVNTVAALERAIAALSQQGGATATVARSLEIRLRTHARLAARVNAANAGAPR